MGCSGCPGDCITCANRYLCLSLSAFEFCGTGCVCSIYERCSKLHTHTQLLSLIVWDSNFVSSESPFHSLVFWSLMLMLSLSLSLSLSDSRSVTLSFNLRSGLSQMNQAIGLKYSWMYICVKYIVNEKIWTFISLSSFFFTFLIPYSIFCHSTRCISLCVRRRRRRRESL